MNPNWPPILLLLLFPLIFVDLLLPSPRWFWPRSRRSVKITGRASRPSPSTSSPPTVASCRRPILRCWLLTSPGWPRPASWFWSTADTCGPPPTRRRRPSSAAAGGRPRLRSRSRPTPLRGGAAVRRSPPTPLLPPRSPAPVAAPARAPLLTLTPGRLVWPRGRGAGHLKLGRSSGKSGLSELWG